MNRYCGEGYGGVEGMSDEEINKNIKGLVTALRGMVVVDMHGYYCNSGHKDHTYIKLKSDLQDHPYFIVVSMEIPLFGPCLYRITKVMSGCGSREVLASDCVHIVLHFELLEYFRRSLKTGKHVMRFVNTSRMRGMMGIPLPY